MHSPTSPRGVLWWDEDDEMIATALAVLSDDGDGEDGETDGA